MTAEVHESYCHYLRRREGSAGRVNEFKTRANGAFVIIMSVFSPSVRILTLHKMALLNRGEIKGLWRHRDDEKQAVLCRQI